ncbi:hypothetical protein BAMA_14545 [Bacillus manliponensis]|uniref:Flagellar protein FlgN n=1 Tax=Bacillus manliponensis TaxID=574376 RepID=A0A073K241_9BACI|nr:hypothetical protein [Bacillus manliponensis]KEK20626.1 hypothetical protein BAMA_14545 [Bacillus manliponensis]
MYNTIYEQLHNIKKIYENINILGDNIYKELQQRDLQAVQPLQLEQLQSIERVKALGQSFQETLEQNCREKGITDVRISSLFSYFSNEEIEKLKELQKSVTTLEENVKMVLSKNQYYLNVLLRTTESIVDSVSEYNMERSHNSQVFINELL